MDRFKPKSGVHIGFKPDNSEATGVCVYEQRDEFLFLWPAEESHKRVYAHNPNSSYSVFKNDGRLKSIMSVCVDCDDGPRPAESIITATPKGLIVGGYIPTDISENKTYFPKTAPESVTDVYNLVKNAYELVSAAHKEIQRGWVTVHQIKMPGRLSNCFTDLEERLEQVPQQFAEAIARISRYDYVREVLRVKLPKRC